MSVECNLCGGSGVVSVWQKCICQYGQSSFAAPTGLDGYATDQLYEKLSRRLIR